MAKVDLDQIRKVYENGHVAVHGASFTVEDGEFVVLVGPSGCGKSTTLRMVAGLEEITSGTLTIGDRVVNDVSPRDRDIAMVFQNYALYPHMTVFDNMAFGLKLRKYPKSEIADRVREAADLLGITAELDRKPKALSGGQRQRVALGRAIVRKPQVFLFDEPLSNLDAKLRVQTRTEISRLHKRLGATMIYVTHDQVEAMTMGDRIVVLKDGHVQQIAPPLTLYQEPANRFVGSFIGSPAMNFIDGAVRRVPEEGWALDAGAMRIPLQNRLASDALAEGQAVSLGIRPEAIRVAAPDEPSFPYRLDVTEPMGNEIFVYATSPGDSPGQVVARVRPQELPEPGQTIPLTFASEGQHLFDRASGTALG